VAGWELPATGDLVREHVVPALVAAGVLAPGERVRVTPAGASQGRGRHPQAQPPGSALVRPGRVRPDPAPAAVSPTAVSPTAVFPAAAAPGPPEVHVHIDRVEVLRAAPPQPAEAAPRQVPRVDHAAYLERRRADRR
jgi:hypothetical protein